MDSAPISSKVCCGLVTFYDPLALRSLLQRSSPAWIPWIWRQSTDHTMIVTSCGAWCSLWRGSPDEMRILPFAEVIPEGRSVFSIFQPAQESKRLPEAERYKAPHGTTRTNQDLALQEDVPSSGLHITIYVFLTLAISSLTSHSDWCENCWWIPSDRNPIKMTHHVVICCLVALPVMDQFIKSQFRKAVDAAFGKDCTVQAHMSRALQMQTQVRKTNHHSKLGWTPHVNRIESKKIIKTEQLGQNYGKQTGHKYKMEDGQELSVHGCSWQFLAVRVLGCPWWRDRITLMSFGCLHCGIRRCFCEKFLAISTWPRTHSTNIRSWRRTW